MATTTITIITTTKIITTTIKKIYLIRRNNIEDLSKNFSVQRSVVERLWRHQQHQTEKNSPLYRTKNKNSCTEKIMTPTKWYLKLFLGIKKKCSLLLSVVCSIVRTYTIMMENPIFTIHRSAIDISLSLICLIALKTSRYFLVLSCFGFPDTGLQNHLK